MAGVNAQAPAGTGVASFKVPRPWELNVPKFTTEDKEDLQDFVEQVDDIIGLGQINDDDEKKRLLTSYLPAKKREIWRALTEYAAGTSYTDFKKAVLKAYPEMQEDLDGTLEELETLCAENRNIKRSEEGRLKRFGMRFRALVKKLSKAPAIILNKEACRRYLDALERGFAETLRMAINTRNLIKEDLLQAGGNAPPAVVPNTVDHRKEDPILLEELIKMAERLANKGSTEVTWGEDDGPEIKRSDRFPTVKIERRDAQLEELGGELSGLRDALAVTQKQSKAAHEELLKAFQNSRSPAPAQGESEQRDSGIRNGPQTTYGTDRQFNRGYGGQVQRNGCYYCDGQDHYSKECSVKTAHINKGWLVVEDGQQKLSDGNYIPRGRGSAAVRVEEYWQKKSTVGQHLNEVFYGGSAEDEFDVLRDEIRTLRVKLNQVAGGSPPMFQPTPVPVMQLQAQVNPYTNQAAPVLPVNMEELGRTVFNMMRASNSMQDQYIQTRSKGRNVAFAEPPEQDF
ncbi:hypothetical protein DFH08DRAFT_961548 [Mycena albidolilacea]|uniref:CCHC-type domain-containing protein n=1 Tax=Mycena albidolilacea TaxID=1033008 RepID=A0AAD6ZZU1_9AGAR|nr:hypothetical protein DFH08DRAFT_961548 [Mycena albidolilacea]